jgi:hypothetical protein
MTRKAGYHTDSQGREGTPAKGKNLRCGGSFLATLPALAKLQDALGEVLRAQPELLHQFPGLAGYSKAVVDPDHIEQQGMLAILGVPKDGACHDVPESSHLMLFGG